MWVNPLADLGNGGWKPHLCTPCHMSIRWPSPATGGKTPPFSIIFCIKNGPFWTSGPLLGVPKGEKWATPKSQLWPTMGGEWGDRWCTPVHNAMPPAWVHCTWAKRACKGLSLGLAWHLHVGVFPNLEKSKSPCGKN